MQYSRQAGFTLIEMLLYVVIVGSLLTATSVFFTVATSARIKNQTISEVEQQGNYAMQYIARTIRNSTAITSPAIGASNASLTITVPTASLSPTVFSLSNGIVQVKEGTATAIPLTGGAVRATNLTFKNLSRSSTVEVVQVSLTLTRVNNAGRNEYDYTKTFVTSAAVRP